MTDEEIIKLFNERSETAISATAALYGERARIVAGNVLNNREDAEECVNEAYYKLWNLIPPNAPKRLGSYFCRIVKYTAIDVLRVKTAEKRGSGECAVTLDELRECVSDNSVENAFEGKELVGRINEFLKKSGAQSRKMFILRYWYCCNVTEVALRCGVSENKVNVTLHRMRCRLRKYLEKEGYEV